MLITTFTQITFPEDFVKYWGLYPLLTQLKVQRNISEIKRILDAELICGEEFLENEVFTACGSDMMSDVLAYVKDQSVLITGLVNPQVIRTANMMDMVCIVFVRSKKPTDEMIELAREHGLVLMTTDKRMYDACGVLYSAGLVGNGGSSHE